MHHWTIEKLSLTVPGYSEDDARELAQYVATALAAWDSHAVAEKKLPSLQLHIAGRHREPPEALARLIVAELARQVA